MNKYLSKLKSSTVSVFAKVSKYISFIFFIIFASLAIYLVIRIGTLARLEPSQTELDSKLSEIKRVKTDTDAISKLEELESRDISIEALFDNGRTNPFED